MPFSLTFPIAFVVVFTVRVIIAFPVVLVGITIVANFLDIGDYEGDKKAGIATVPVVLGLSRSKLIIGAVFPLMYAALYFVLDYLDAPLYWIAVFIFLGIVQFFFINRKDYKEYPAMLNVLVLIWLLVYLVARYAGNVVPVM